MLPLIFGLFGALFYFGDSEVRRFENLAAKDIRAQIHGDRAKVTVRTQLNGLIGGPLGDLKEVTIRASNFEAEGIPIFTEPGLSMKGIIRNLKVILKDFTLTGLRVQEFATDIPDCRYDYGLAVGKRKIRLSQSGVGRGQVGIGEKDLEAFILRKFVEIKRVSVRVADDRVFVEGYGKFIILKANFAVEARLIAIDGVKLALSEAKITFDGKPADPLATQTLLDTLNPVVDLDKDLKLYGAIRVDRIELRDGLIRVFGTTRVPDAPLPPKPG